QAPVLSHLSKGHSPRSPVTCQYAFGQIPVSHLYDLLSTVVSSSVNFGSNSDVWCDLTLMYLDLGAQLLSRWKLFWALWLPFVLSVSSICHQFSSCGHIQGGWLQSPGP